ncbi:MAG TPA: hypothetical protein VH763_14135 [Gemmatimonadales bacterium]|jgi:hypothetical protein
MSRWTRRFAALVLGAVLAAAVGCSSEGPTAPPTEVPEAAILDLFRNLHLLSCSTQPYAVTTRTVGPQGGIITVGTHHLVIPADALKSQITIRAEQVPGSTNSVRFSPEGLTFQKPATLTLSYSNCSLLLSVLKKVVYTDERLRILELLPSLDLRFNRTVTGSIRHFSRYAVAW